MKLFYHNFLRWQPRSERKTWKRGFNECQLVSINKYSVVAVFFQKRNDFFFRKKCRRIDKLKSTNRELAIQGYSGKLNPSQLSLVEPSGFVEWIPNHLGVIVIYSFPQLSQQTDKDSAKPTLKKIQTPKLWPFIANSARKLSKTVPDLQPQLPRKNQSSPKPRPIDYSNNVESLFQSDLEKPDKKEMQMQRINCKRK